MFFYCSLWQEKFQRIVTCAINRRVSIAASINQGSYNLEIYLLISAVWPQECKIRSALQNETTVTKDPMTSLCMVRKCRVNRILLLVNLIWYCALFYSRAAWQIFSINKAKTVRAFLSYCEHFPNYTVTPWEADALGMGACEWLGCR